MNFLDPDLELWLLVVGIKKIYHSVVKKTVRYFQTTSCIQTAFIPIHKRHFFGPLRSNTYSSASIYYIRTEKYSPIRYVLNRGYYMAAPFRCHFAQCVAANFCIFIIGKIWNKKSAKMKTVSVCFFLNTIAEGKCGRMVFRDRSLFVAWGGGVEGGGGI